MKSKTLVKHQTLVKNFQTKIGIIVKNRDFGQNRNFCHESKYLGKNLIFYQKSIF